MKIRTKVKILKMDAGEPTEAFERRVQHVIEQIEKEGKTDSPVVPFPFSIQTGLGVSMMWVEKEEEKILPYGDTTLGI